MIKMGAEEAEALRQDSSRLFNSFMGTGNAETFALLLRVDVQLGRFKGIDLASPDEDCGATIKSVAEALGAGDDLDALRIGGIRRSELGLARMAIKQYIKDVEAATDRYQAEGAGGGSKAHATLGKIDDALRYAEEAETAGAPL